MDSILDQLMDKLEDSFIEGEIRNPNRVWITVEQTAIRSVASLLKTKFGVSRVSMITGIETIQGFEVLYHFERINEMKLSELITVRIHIPLENPVVDSIRAIIPSASVYEIELHELLQIDFKE